MMARRSRAETAARRSRETTKEGDDMTRTLEARGPLYIITEYRDGRWIASHTFTTADEVRAYLAR